MSTLAVNTITNAAGGNTAQINGMTPTADSLQGFRNRIINGNMVIDQRNAGASVSISSATNTYTLDRWRANASGGGVFSVQRSTTAPAGFTNSLLATVTTVDSSIGSGDFYHVRQSIEGFNFSDFGFGSASAQSITLSFWVRNSLTGTFTVLLRNEAGNRGYLATYTVNTANTWEQKSITIAGDTTGTWATDNTSAVIVSFVLGSGSTQTTGVWGTSTVEAATGMTQWIATSGATFYITGVQLEAGSVATPFERIDYGRQLIQCQRYLPAINASSGTSEAFGSGGAASTTVTSIYYPFNTTARVKPTGIIVSSASHFQIESPGAGGAVGSCTDLIFGQASVNGSRLVTTTTAGTPTLVAGQSVLLRSNSANNGQILFTGCEL
jgi:hypothetical protein